MVFASVVCGRHEAFSSVLGCFLARVNRRWQVTVELAGKHGRRRFLFMRQQVLGANPRWRPRTISSTTVKVGVVLPGPLQLRRSLSLAGCVNAGTSGTGHSKKCTNTSGTCTGAQKTTATGASALTRRTCRQNAPSSPCALTSGAQHCLRRRCCPGTLGKTVVRCRHGAASSKWHQVGQEE
jgi:hypothetical protein